MKKTSESFVDCNVNVMPAIFYSYMMLHKQYIWSDCFTVIRRRLGKTAVTVCVTGLVCRETVRHYFVIRSGFGSVTEAS